MPNRDRLFVEVCPVSRIFSFTDAVSHDFNSRLDNGFVTARTILPKAERSNIYRVVAKKSQISLLHNELVPLSIPGTVDACLVAAMTTGTCTMILRPCLEAL